jgi:gliding motility-associated-like protein
MLWSLVVGAQDPQWRVCAGDTGSSYYVSGWETSTFEWTVEGGTITRNYGDSIIVDWPAVPGLYTITVQETSAQGCVGELRSGVVEVVAPDVDLGADSYVCAGDMFEIEPSGDYAFYLWHDGSTGSSYVTDQEGWIRVEVTDAAGCTARDSMYLSVYDLPEVDLGPDTVVCGDAGVELDAGTDGVSYLWSTGDITQVITVYISDQEQYWVEVENTYGCLGGDTVIVRNCSLEFYFRDIPTAITPSDGNGLNDYWIIDQLQAFPQAVVEIYDRWGTLIWRSEPGYPDPWDGRNMNGREMPMESYHFVIHMETGAKDDIVKGIITVIR